MKTNTAEFHRSILRLAAMVEDEATFKESTHRRNTRKKYLGTTMLAAAEPADLLEYAAHIYKKYGAK
jgi:hypothetical protein